MNLTPTRVLNLFLNRSLRRVLSFNRKKVIDWVRLGSNMQPPFRLRLLIWWLFAFTNCNPKSIFRLQKILWSQKSSLKHCDFTSHSFCKVRLDDWRGCCRGWECLKTAFGLKAVSFLCLPKSLRQMFFSSCHELGRKKKFWIPSNRNRTYALRCSTTEPQRLHGERGLLWSSYDTRPTYC